LSGNPQKVHIKCNGHAAQVEIY